MAAEVPYFVPYYLNTTAPGGGGSTASGTFVDFPGPITKNFRKIRQDTALLVSGHVGAYKTVAAGAVTIGLRVNSVDALIGRFYFNDLSSHREISFHAPVFSGLLPGPYTATLRWLVSGNGVSVDGNDVIHLVIQEGYFI